MSRILLTNIPASHSVAVTAEAALSVKVDATSRLRPMTLRALLGGIAFLLELQFHSGPFGFVRGVEAHLAVRPLVELLIRFFAVIEILPNVPHIADRDGLHSSV